MAADALAIPLRDESVDLIVTSPPYYNARDYLVAGIGQEASTAEYLNDLVLATEEMKRVLKPTGSIFVNLGDRYVNKVLLGMPWRYAIAAADKLSLNLAAEIVWSKPNGLPESSRKRVGRTHEHWFHLTKQMGFYADIEAARVPHEDKRKARRAITGQHGGGVIDQHKTDPAGMQRLMRRKVGDVEPKNPKGKLPGSVWVIPTEPLKVPPHLGIDHYAPFPTRWPYRLIKGWCPPSGVVLDPFGGSGTTAMIAKAMGRVGISLDLSEDYCKLAHWRVFQSGHGDERVKKEAS